MSFCRRHYCSLFLVVENPDIAAELLNLDLDKIMAWAKNGWYALIL